MILLTVCAPVNGLRLHEHQMVKGLSSTVTLCTALLRQHATVVIELSIAL